MCLVHYKLESKNVLKSSSRKFELRPLEVIRKDSKEIEEIRANKQPIGKFYDPKPFTTHKVELREGDTVYIFSDGFADQFGGDKGKKFKTRNLRALLLSIQGYDMDTQRQKMTEAFEEWKQDFKQVDDVCVIGYRR